MFDGRAFHSFLSYLIVILTNINKLMINVRRMLKIIKKIKKKKNTIKNRLLI